MRRIIVTARYRRPALLLVVILVNLALLTELVQAATFTGTLTPSTPTESPRLFRNNIASTCAGLKPFPGTGGSGSYHYLAYNITNDTGQSQCVTVTVSTPCSLSDNGIHSVAYLGSFNPANLSANYLADSGSSAYTDAGVGHPASYSFTLGAGQTAVLVANENVLNTGCSFTLTTSFGGGAGAFFNPGDDRVDPRPGDRLAVYCNQRNKIVVYGIADNLPQEKSGIPLATFSYKAVKAAGKRGLTRYVGTLGSVSISLNKGWFWVAWNGGKYRATGKDIFVKNFEDAVWCARAH